MHLIMINIIDNIVAMDSVADLNAIGRGFGEKRGKNIAQF